MRRQHRIIALIACLLWWPAVALPGTMPSFAAYRVHVAVARNGIDLGSHVAQLQRGSTAAVQLAQGIRRLRLNQRVTGFPGAGADRALLQLELYVPNGGGERRLAAPTYGVELGRSEEFDLKTEQGRYRIRATVEGVSPEATAADLPLETHPYPGW